MSALSRTRWPEYRRLLDTALKRGYEVVSLESWVEAGKPRAARTLILRHDVDQHPRAVLPMARIELALGLRSTWYFRWRTAHPLVVRWLIERGFSVGLHYETLSRAALHGMLDRDSLVERALEDHVLVEHRELLRREISAFVKRHGPIRSVCPHGDSRVPEVQNGVLLSRQDCVPYGVKFDGNDAMRDARLEYWLTDRSTAGGGWNNGIDPLELFPGGASPLLCLTHPHLWTSSASRLLDLALSGLFPVGRSSSPWPIRTGHDTPPPEPRHATFLGGGPHA